ncbi:putative GEM-like protein 8 [Cucurbita moschata]|uniref:GEM-like protein 8 n=1 Tax=Cucurbita moschata TaxID=3662 RepID=A0A6J1GPT0_CUCMO|nr:putative GEM-like protein 8 [Cucurbita moschata]XP_022953476.1 putative GEM-like protein 8 [Cucurbita moschata]
MEASLQRHVIGFPLGSAALQVEQSVKRLLPDLAGQYNIPPSDGKYPSKQCSKNSVLSRVNKLGKKADKFAHGVREHVRLGSNISEIVKGKLSLGARILQVGGLRKIYKQLFSDGDSEKLLKAAQCYLSTTAGPIAGLLFISTDKIAFCSDRSIKVSSSSGELIRFHYKVVIPVGKIERINESENVKKPSQKYIEIVTVDNFDFWFMGFLNYYKTLQYLQNLISLECKNC